MGDNHPVIAAALQRLSSRLESKGPCRLIGLAGVPGSGKSTFAAHLAEAVNTAAGPGTMVALGMDGFHLTKAQLRAMPNPEEAFARRGAPWTFDPAALALRLQSLRQSREPVTWPEFQHDIGDPVEGAVIVPPAARLVLVEGLYLLHRSDGWEPISQSFDERWLLDTPITVAVERLIQRHIGAWGMTRQEAESRIASNDHPNGEIVIQDRDYADWIFCPTAV